MGHDNIKFSRYINLSTIDQMMYDIGTRAMHQLNSILDDEPAERLQSATEPKLIARNSTKKSKQS
jgi:DNA-binding LacI/PurR family transcriptional regulator